MATKYPKAGKSLFYTGIGMFVVAPCCLVGQYFCHQEYEVYKAKGVDGSAIVVDKRTEDHTDTNGNTDTTYILSLDFNCPTAGHIKDYRYVSQSDFNDSKVGSSIAVRYLQDQPSKFKLKTDAEDDGSALTWVAGMFAAIGAAFMTVGWRVDARVARASQNQSLAQPIQDTSV